MLLRIFLYIKKNDLGVFFYSINIEYYRMISPQKKPKFFCEKCNFSSNNKKDWSRHVGTAKHLKLNDLNPKKPLLPKIYICTNCNKEFNANNSLWYHKKKCFPKKKEEEEPQLSEMSDCDPSDPNIVFELIKQNQEFKELIVEQHHHNKNLQNQLLEVAKEGKTINNNNVNNTNNTTFNLQFFLNEQCKNALNLTDFVDSIQLSLNDLQETGRLGYIDGISRVFVKALRDLDENERPIHCTDAKREIVYIKDENRWEKDTRENSKIKQTIKEIQNKKIQMLPDWQEKNPECTVMDSKENDEFVKISLHTLGNDEEKQDDKIVKNIMKEVVIDKNSVKEAGKINT